MDDDADLPFFNENEAGSKRRLMSIGAVLIIILISILVYYLIGTTSKLGTSITVTPTTVTNASTQYTHFVRYQQLTTVNVTPKLNIFWTGTANTATQKYVGISAYVPSPPAYNGPGVLFSYQSTVGVANSFNSSFAAATQRVPFAFYATVVQLNSSKNANALYSYAISSYAQLAAYPHNMTNITSQLGTPAELSGSVQRYGNSAYRMFMVFFVYNATFVQLAADELNSSYSAASAVAPAKNYLSLLMNRTVSQP